MVRHSDKFVSLYGSNLKIEYEIEDTEIYDAEYISDMADSINDGGGDSAEFFMYYASDVYYSPVFSEMKSIQEIRLFTGTLKYTGDLYTSDDIPFTACVIKYEGQWYYVGKTNTDNDTMHYVAY